MQKSYYTVYLDDKAVAGSNTFTGTCDAIVHTMEQNRQSGKRLTVRTKTGRNATPDFLPAFAEYIIL